MTTVEVVARAKINLTLHVTGLCADGYHELDSLVTFADLGDRLTLQKASKTRLRVCGPFADDVPTDASNLVLRAAELLGVTAEIHLEKRLPVASGIGGGSADAAAALEGLSDLYNIPMPSRAEMLRLGADVPVCAMGGIVRMRGIGEEIEPISDHSPNMSVILVNPMRPVSTPEVFSRLASKTNPPMEEPIPQPNLDTFADWLCRQRNDLEEPAIQLVPDIAEALASLGDQEGAELARMSGSGATCFALFYDEGLARVAVSRIQEAHPDWWVVLATD